MQVQNEKQVESKKPYTQPMLTTHGSVQSLTQVIPIGGGSGLPVPK